MSDRPYTQSDIPTLADHAATVTDTVLRDYFDFPKDPAEIVRERDRISSLLHIAIDCLSRIRNTIR